MTKKITLVPVGLVDEKLLDWLQPVLQSFFGYPVDRMQRIAVPERAYNPQREQYSSSVILERILRQIPASTSKMLGITEVDFYSEGLNFVFGEAYVGGDAAVISLHRLHPEFYGLSPEPQLFHQRVLKEAVHELGHAFGLTHCENPRCVMYYSNTIEDTDRKGPGFCIHCQARLSEKH